MRYPIRFATRGDRLPLQALIARSARELSRQDYSSEQVEGALQGAFGVDTQLIDDQTYFVAEFGQQLVGCGGWSWRRTLFGGDSHAARDASPLVPGIDAAKIRAFFVHPDYARRGIGRAILEHCENCARALGFTRFELMATLPGVPLYRALGYVPGQRVRFPVAAGVDIEFIPMSKG